MHGLVCLLLAGYVVISAQTAAEIFNNAVSALSRGDYAAAESGFQEILKSSPNHVDTLRNLGVVYSRTGRLDQAITVYRRALQLFPRDKAVLLNLGLTYIRKHSFADALPVFQTLVEEDNSSLPARDIHLLFPLCDGYLKQDHTTEGRRKLETFLALVPPAAASLVRCKLFYISENLNDAAQQCRLAVKTDPRYPGVHLELARVLVAQHSAEAAGELAAAIRENPQDPEALYDLGVALLQEGRSDESSRYLERARAGNPDFWGSYFQLGKLLLQSHQPAKAVPMLRKAAELNPASFSIFYELARALRATGDTEGASRAMQKVRELMAREIDEDARAIRKK
jgi:Flp pilus assembly protein TadD